jgi:hypothetical protein
LRRARFSSTAPICMVNGDPSHSPSILILVA